MNQVTEKLEKVTVLFAGDSGDGIQLTGTQFTNNTALHGNDLSTFPDFPAEIRAPLGTLAGGSGFQINFGSTDVFTPGDLCDVLVVMNAAALGTCMSSIAVQNMGNKSIKAHQVKEKLIEVTHNN